MLIARKVMILLPLPCLLIALTGCGPGQAGVDAPEGTVAVRGAGATFPAPLYRKWIEEYAVSHDEVIVHYDSVGSGEGTERFIAGTVDFGASDAAMSDEEMAQVGRGVQLIPTAAGSIALAYNLNGLSGDLKLSRDVYVRIFKGDIKKWNHEDIARDNEGLDLPNKDISVVARLDSSGTTYAFTNHLNAITDGEWDESGPGMGKQIDWPGSAMRGNGNEGVSRLIQLTPGAIGYVEYGIASRAGLAMAHVENRAGNFAPPTGTSGMATLANADLPANLRAFFPDPKGEDSYPIVTYTWLLLYKEYEDAEVRDGVKDFVTWCLTDGQRYNEELGYIRLPKEIAGRALTALDSLQ